MVLIMASCVAVTQAAMRPCHAMLGARTWAAVTFCSVPVSLSTVYDEYLARMRPPGRRSLRSCCCELMEMPVRTGEPEPEPPGAPPCVMLIGNCAPCAAIHGGPRRKTAGKAVKNFPAPLRWPLAATGRRGSPGGRW